MKSKKKKEDKTLYLVEQHHIKMKHPFYQECDELCFKSKTLFNLVNDHIKHMLYEGLVYPDIYYCYRFFQNSHEYKSLPDKVAKQVLISVDEAWKSFFAAIKSHKVNKSKFKGRPRTPNNKDLIVGRMKTTYEKHAISKMEFKRTGKIALSMTDIKIKMKKKVDYDSLKEVRIIPKLRYYVIEIVYDTKKLLNSVPKKTDHITGTDVKAFMDLGVNNLMTVTFSNGIQPFIINGKPLKSINHYYNRKLAKLKSELPEGVYTSRAIQTLTIKRKNKIKDYLHKATKKLVNHLTSKDTRIVVIGYNAGIKQGINISSRNNQNFVGIPFLMLKNMISYKSFLKDIQFLETEESYTSKCSFLDNEPLCKQSKYLGNRIKRGLFQSSTGRLINADVNGSYNIGRKAFPNGFKANGIQGVALHPLLLNVRKELLSV